MANDVPGEMSGEDIIATAVSATRDRQKKVRELLERALASTDAFTVKRAAIVRELAAVEEQLSILERRLDDDRSTELALDILSLAEQQRALNQQEAKLTGQITRLAAMNRHLRLAIRQDDDLASRFSQPESTSQGCSSDTAWRVVQAQEEERQRLAREIHDGPAQVLANAVFELEFCERLIEKNPTKLQRELARLKEDIRQSLADVRHFIFGLRPTVLTDLGLSATLRRYCDDYSNRCGVAVKLDVPDRLSVTGAVEVAIFRIIQEALQNARKHSECSSIWLQLVEQEGRMAITIEDDGHGFDVPDPATHNVGRFGLQGMRERARLIGAQLEVTSRPGAGTKIQLVIPRECYAPVE